MKVYGGLGPDGSFKLTRLKGTIKSEKYVTLLKDEVLHYIVSKFYEYFILQQDNAPPHVSKMSNNFLKSRVKTLTWLRHSVCVCGK